VAVGIKNLRGGDAGAMLTPRITHIPTRVIMLNFVVLVETI